MAPIPARPATHTFLLRAWFEHQQPNSAAGVWRFSLEATHTGARRGFADFEALVAFLADQLEAGPANNPETYGGDR